MEPKRLYRSITDRKFAGVSGGLAEYFEIDPLFIRLIFVVLTLAGGGGALIYIVLWIVTPEHPFLTSTGYKTTEELSLSVKTVSTHKTHILAKMNMSTQVDLVRYAIDQKLVDE